MSQSSGVMQEESSPRTTRAAKKAQEDSQRGFEVRIDKKIARLEQAMETMAASVTKLAKKKAKKRKNKDREESPAPPAKKPKKTKKQAKKQVSDLDPSQRADEELKISDFSSAQQAPTDGLPATSSNIPQQAAPAPATRPTTSTTTLPQFDDGASQNQVRAPPQDVRDVNKQRDWSTWLLDTAEMLPQQHAKPTSISELPPSTALQA